MPGDTTILPTVCQDGGGGLHEATTKRRGDLIVLARHSASGRDEWLFGSNAGPIVRCGECPVLQPPVWPFLLVSCLRLVLSEGFTGQLPDVGTPNPVFT
ncbi:MAG: universal stress protein [Bacteroidetes bacterium]|nr:universal stress protein [Fibrella sp.]